MDEFETIKLLADDELIQRVHHGIREDRRVSALLLAHFGEMDARELHRDLGYESMFDYAIRALHMSDSEAGLRLYAARFARRFPASLGMLSRGELHLTAMKLLSPVLTNQNTELLKEACLKTKQEIQLLIAKHCPQPDAPEVIRRLPARTASGNAATFLAGGDEAAAQSALFSERAATACPSNADARLCSELPEESKEPGAVQRSSASITNSSVRQGSSPPSAASIRIGSDIRGERTLDGAMPAVGDCRAELSFGMPGVVHSRQRSNRDPITPISEGRFKIQFTANQRIRDLLEEAQDLYRNQLPRGDLDVIVERALCLLVAARKKELFAQTDKPRRGQSVTSPRTAAAPASSATARSAGEKPRSRRPSNEVKRRVFARDQGQCIFVGVTGKRCAARGRLEFHHVHAFGLGGATTEANIVLCCRTHNRLFAERDFTREHIQRCIRASQAARANGQLAELTHRAAAVRSLAPAKFASGLQQRERGKLQTREDTNGKHANDSACSRPEESPRITGQF